MSISVSLSKVSAAVAGLVLAFALATTASAQTTSCYTFTLNHKLGNTGGEVLWLQKFLNMNAATAVAASGAGSAGMETTRFGGLTKAAVMKFQAANGISPVSGYWGPLTRAKANALEAARCAGGTTGGTTTPATGDATIAAAAQPGNSLAVKGAARVPFTKFTVTAGANPVTLNSVTVERGGLAADAAFDKIILLDDQGMMVGTEKVLNSNHQATIGATVVIPAGTTKTFTVAANMSSDQTTMTNAAGQVAVFSVVSANTSGTVAGSLPITGAQHTINASLGLGTATADRGPLDPAAVVNKEIGTTGYTFASYKVTAGSAEKIRVWGFRVNQSGSAATSDLANIKMTVDGTEYVPTLSSDGKYYQFNFGAGLVIDKGLSKEFTVKGDIVGGSGRTASFDIYRLTDVQVTGETYGYGITATAGSNFSASANPAYNASDVTINAGTFNSVSKSNVVASGNIAKQKSDEVLGAFTVDLKGEKVQVQTLKMDIVATGATANRTITNVKLVDASGAVLAGPVDASSASLAAGTNANALTFSSVTFPAGATTVYVKGQLDTDWANGETVAIATTPSTQWTGVTGETSGNNISLASLSSTSTANVMTVKDAALVVKTLTTPPASSLVKGSTKVLFAAAALDGANSGDDVRVSNITLTDTVANSAVVTDIDNVEVWADLTSASNSDSRYGKYETRLKSAEQFAASTLVLALDTQVTVPKNGAVEIGVFADLSANAISTGGNRTHKVNVTAATATAMTSGQALAGSLTFSGPGQALTVADNGALTTTIDSGNAANTATLLKDDTTNEQFLASYKLSASNVEDIRIESLKVTATNANAVQKYVFYKGATRLGEVIGGSATAQIFFTGANPTLVVPKNDSVVVTVKGVLNNVDGSQLVNGATIGVDIALTGDVDARSSSTGATISASGTATGAVHKVFEVVPVFASQTLSNTTLTPNAQYLAARFQVTANGDKDVTFTTAQSNLLVLNAVHAGFTTSGSPAVTVKDTASGLTLGTGALADNAGGTSTITISTWTNPFTVSAGSSKSFDVLVDTSLSDGSTGGSDSLYVYLDDAAAGNLSFSVNNGATNTVGDLVFKSDIYGPTHTRN